MSAILEHEDALPPDLLAPTLRCLGSSATIGGDSRGLAAYERALALYRELGDDFGVAAMTARVGAHTLYGGGAAAARELADESLELHRRLGSRGGEAQALGLVAEIEWHEGRREQALELLGRGVALAHESGFRWWEANMLGSLAEWSLELGAPTRLGRRSCASWSCGARWATAT